MRKFDIIKIPFHFIISYKPLLLLMLLFASATGTTQNNLINDSVYTYKTKSLTEPTTPASLSSIHFTKAPGNRINFGITGCEYNCILLKLSSPYTVENKYLSIDNTSLDTVSIFKINSNGNSKLLYQGGELVPFDSKRNYVWHTAPLQINTDPAYYLIALKASQKNINLKYELLDSDALQHKYESYERLVFIYIGVAFMLIAIIIFALLLFKNKIFAAYLGYVVCVSTWILSHYDRLFPFAYPNVPELNQIVKPVSTLASSLFLVIVLSMVFRQQLQTRAWHRLLLNRVKYALLILTGLMLLLLIHDLNINVKAGLIAAWHFALIFSLCVIVFTPASFIKTGIIAKIFSLAMLSICIMTIMQLLANTGIINNFFLSEHGMAMGSLFENSIMAFGLFYNLLEEKRYSQKQILFLQQAQTDTLKKLITVQDNERKRIANDLHDNIGPLLAALKNNFSRITHAKEPGLQKEILGKTESIINDSIAEIRNVALNMMPKGLSSNGLINTLKEYFESIQQAENKAIAFHHEIQSIPDPDLQLNLYRIVCELVLNAVKHSQAEHITVCITSNHNLISLRISDDGQGIKTKLNGHKKSLGLQSAVSRVNYMKGTFGMKTENGKGTTVEIEIPLQPDEAHVGRF